MCGVDEDHLTKAEVKLLEKGNRVRELLRGEIVDDIIMRAIAWKKKVGSESRAIFVTSKGQRWKNYNISRVFRQAQEEAGLPIYLPHELRHTMGTAAGKLGSKTDDIKALLGHASRATSEIYVHTDEETARDTRVKVVRKLYGLYEKAGKTEEKQGIETNEITCPECGCKFHNSK